MRVRLCYLLVNRAKPQQNPKKTAGFRTHNVRIDFAEFPLFVIIISQLERPVKRLLQIKQKDFSSSIFALRCGYCSTALWRSQGGKYFRLNIDKPYYKIPISIQRMSRYSAWHFFCAKIFLIPFSLTSPTPSFQFKSHLVNPCSRCPCRKAK